MICVIWYVCVCVGTRKTRKSQKHNNRDAEMWSQQRVTRRLPCSVIPRKLSAKHLTHVAQLKGFTPFWSFSSDICFLCVSLLHTHSNKGLYLIEGNHSESRTNHNQPSILSLRGNTVTSDVTLNMLMNSANTHAWVLLLYMQILWLATEKPPLQFTASYHSPFRINTLVIRDQLEMFQLVKRPTLRLTRLLVRIFPFSSKVIQFIWESDVLSCTNYKFTFHFSLTLTLMFSSKLISIPCISHLFTFSIPLPSSPASASC